MSEARAVYVASLSESLAARAVRNLHERTMDELQQAMNMILAGRLDILCAMWLTVEGEPL